MNILETISALRHATQDNPVGDESLLPYWEFFWKDRTPARASDGAKVRVFLLHVYLHYLNHNKERSGVFLDVTWPEWMIEAAQWHTRPSLRISVIGKDNRLADAAAKAKLQNFGVFREKTPSMNTGLSDRRGQPGELPGASLLTIYRCPGDGIFRNRIQVRQGEAKGTTEAPHLWALEPYNMIVGFVA